MSLNLFWSTLEELIGCEDSRHGWSAKLEGGFDQVSFLLRSSGSLASTVRCPSAGGESCPRQVRPDGNGSFIAVCGNRPAECSDLKLSLDDVRIFALDFERLAGDLASALSLRADYAPAASIRQTWRVGFCDVAAGAAFPVYLTIQEFERVLHRGDREHMGFPRWLSCGACADPSFYGRRGECVYR